MDDNNTGNIVIYQREDGKTHLEVKYEQESLWLSQQQICDLYQTSRTNVVEHIKHIYEDGELKEQSTCRKFRQVRQEGARQVEREMTYYNLDMILSIGYRVRSLVASHFRQWATERLTEYLYKGSFKGDHPTLRDAKIAKNYLDGEELEILNNLVSGYFDFAKTQAKKHRPMYMADYIEHLDRILSANGDPLLQGAGSVSHRQAIEKAETEYRKWEVKTLSPVEEAYLATIKMLNNKGKNKK